MEEFICQLCGGRQYLGEPHQTAACIKALKAEIEELKQAIGGVRR